jgi:hypothetical protein
VEITEALHIKVALVSPTASGGVWRIDDAPSFGRMPLPHYPEFAHASIIAQAVRPCPRTYGSPV